MDVVIRRRDLKQIDAPQNVRQKECLLPSPDGALSGQRQTARGQGRDRLERDKLVTTCRGQDAEEVLRNIDRSRRFV